MKTTRFTVQYSVPTEKRIAVSDWLERTKIIISDTPKNAIKKFNRLNQDLGTWMILDCYPEP